MTGVSSFSDLISHDVHRAFLWIIGVLTIVGNALVLGGRNLAKTENRILAMFVKNLAGLPFENLIKCLSNDWFWFIYSNRQRQTCASVSTCCASASVISVSAGNTISTRISGWCHGSAQSSASLPSRRPRFFFNKIWLEIDRISTIFQYRFHFFCWRSCPSSDLYPYPIRLVSGPWISAQLLSARLSSGWSV